LLEKKIITAPNWVRNKKEEGEAVIFWFNNKKTGDFISVTDDWNYPNYNESHPNIRMRFSDKIAKKSRYVAFPFTTRKSVTEEGSRRVIERLENEGKLCKTKAEMDNYWKTAEMWSGKE